MIFIGAVYGGPEASGSYVDLRIIRLMKAVILLREASCYPASTPEVNVVFHVSGSLSKVDFEGVRHGSFSRKRRLLMVQVAVPDEMVESPSLDSFLIDSLRQANRVAFERFAKKGIDFPLPEADDLVKRVEQALNQN